MNGIEDIGLACAVVTHKAVNPLGECDIGLREVLEIDE
jgi:hypothetical protein